MDADELIKARNEIDTEMIQLSIKIKQLQATKIEYECEIWEKCDHSWVRDDDCGVGWTPKSCSTCRLSSCPPHRRSSYLINNLKHG